MTRMENLMNNESLVQIESSIQKNGTIIDFTLNGVSTNLDNNEIGYLKMSESSTKFWDNSEDEWWNEV